MFGQVRAIKMVALLFSLAITPLNLIFNVQLMFNNLYLLLFCDFGFLQKSHFFYSREKCQVFFEEESVEN